jgi:hypothetical protein
MPPEPPPPPELFAAPKPLEPPEVLGPAKPEWLALADPFERVTLAKPEELPPP